MISKRYSEGRIDECPFCGKQAIAENDQGIPVCPAHKGTSLPEMKCLCGEYLFMQKGKFGVYFNCLRCGNVSLRRALEINNVSNEPIVVKEDRPSVRQVKYNNPGSGKPKVYHVGDNIVIRSDDPDFFD